LIRALAASLIMGVLLWWGAGRDAEWFALESVPRLLKLVVWIGIGAVVYGVSLLALGLRPRHFREQSGAPARILSRGL
jgi:putative peptidoglycan lipid II flippase